MIRPAQASDAPVIADLTCQLGYAVDVPATAERIKDLLAKDDHFVAVAVVDDQVVGWMQAHACVTLESGFRAEILGLVVSDAVRRRGVGRDLVAAAEAWALTKGAETLVVRSNVQRTESHAFYPALGFSLSKTQSVYRKRIGS